MIQTAKHCTSSKSNDATTTLSTIEKLVDTAWQVTYCALWPTAQLSTKEIKEAKSWIRYFLQASKHPLKAYHVFCQRILLARDYLLQREGRYIPLPSQWLHPNNEKGFAGTKSWYTELDAVRMSLPLHKSELRAFGEAVLEMALEPTARNFQYWKHYFIEKRIPGFHSLFLVTIANQHYQTK